MERVSPRKIRLSFYCDEGERSGNGLEKKEEKVRG